MLAKRLRGLVLLFLFPVLGGCQAVLLNPSGDVARQQSHLMLASVVLLSLIIVPVIVAVFVIAWRYRASNTEARYDAEWDHSTKLELVVWAAPLLIIIALGAMTWIGTHQLDPYQPLTRVAEGTSLNPTHEPLQVEVVSLRWKWLFIYPQYGIATVNDAAVPVDLPVHFKLTSDTMMDSFFVPALAGQIYTMPGMQTQLNAVMNRTGTFDGFSANYSGLGFTDMRFTFHGMTQQDFQQWVTKARASGKVLDMAAFRKLAEKSRDVKPQYYAGYAAGLYQRVLNRCVTPGSVCLDKVMARDARANREPTPEIHPVAPSGSHDAPAH